MDFKTHKSINSITKEILESSSIRLVCKLGNILEQRGMNQTELSLLTGIRQPSINDIIHQKKNTVNIQHLLAIMLTLKLTDLTDIYEVVFEDIDEEVQLKIDKDKAEMLGILQEQYELIQERKKEKGLD